MMVQGAQREELVELLGLLRDGPLSVGQAARLDELVCGDEAACTLYVCYAHMHTGLRYYTGRGKGVRYILPERPEGCFAQNVPDPFSLCRWTREYFSQPVPFSMLTAAIFMVCVVAMLEILPAPTYTPTHIGSNSTAGGTGLRPVKGKLKLVARITGLHNCRWSPEGRAPLSYDHMGIGRELKLDAGLVEITYYNGAKLVLEGPVTFTVEEENACRLELGILTAKVSQQAVGFTVKTPTAEIVDLGTEFGVQVEQGGTADVHVFVGQVEVGGKMDGRRRRLAAGQSVKIDTSGKVTETSGSSGRFAFAAMFSDGQWARSLSYVDVVLASRPIGYWRLDDSGTADAIDSSPNENHAVYSSVVEYGRESFSPAIGTAAHFDGSADGLVVGAADVPNVYSLLANNFTVEAWVRCDFTTEHLGLIAATGTPDRKCWGFFYDSRPDRGVGFGFVTYGIKAYRFTLFPVPENTWTHVVVAFDRSNNAHLYLNGQYKQSVTGHKPVTAPESKCILLLGGTDFEPWEGDLDEVAIYDRVLSPNEIALHYAARSTPPNLPEPDDKQPIETPQNPGGQA